MPATAGALPERARPLTSGGSTTERTTRGSALAAIGIASLVAAGCGSNVSVTTTGAAPALGAQDLICVATAADGRHEQRVHAGSGAKVTARTATALRQRHGHVVVIGAGDLPRLSTECRARSGRFLVVPEILEWEDRASGWSGQPDRVRVQLTLHDLDGETAPHSVAIEAKTDYWSSAVGEWGNRPPESLLGDDFDLAVQSLLSP